MTAAKCYCFTPQQADAVIIYLLAQIAGNTSTPAQLAEAAKCYCFGNTPSRDAVMLYLLCAIANDAV